MKTNQILDQFDYAETGELVSRKDLLNDTSVLYKGIFGMILCVLGAMLGLILVRICLNQAKEALDEYQRNPGVYKMSSFNRVKKGQRFAYIGVGIIIAEVVALVAVMSAH